MIIPIGKENLWLIWHLKDNFLHMNIPAFGNRWILLEIKQNLKIYGIVVRHRGKSGTNKLGNDKNYGKKLLEWKPQYDINTGLQKTIRHYMDFFK